MNELEWYLNIGGKQSGPHSAKEIVELVRAGKIPNTSQVTTARMNGDWVTANDLIEAYDELYSKKQIATPISPLDPDRTALLSENQASGSGFRAPPRPTEQIEATKTIYLNRGAQERAPDATDALFQAVQAVREKIREKSPPPSSLAAGVSPMGRDTRGTGPNFRLSPQVLFIGVLAVIFGGAVYGITLFINAKSKPQAESKKTSTPSSVSAEPPSRVTTSAKSPLLNEVPAPHPRVANPVSQSQPSSAGRAGGNAASNPQTLLPNGNRARALDRLERGGGARYRDERDPPLPMHRDSMEEPEQPDIDEGEFSGQEAAPAPLPVDPSQVPLVNPGGPEGGLSPGAANPFEAPQE